MNKKEVVATRHKLGLTQEQFGQELGVTIRSVSRWESGEASPSPIAIRLIRNLSKNYIAHKPE